MASRLRRAKSRSRRKARGLKPEAAKAYTEKYRALQKNIRQNKGVIALSKKKEDPKGKQKDGFPPKKGKK
jgi:hypothetical protein